jgi:hypothetical protein
MGIISTKNEINTKDTNLFRTHFNAPTRATKIRRMKRHKDQLHCAASYYSMHFHTYAASSLKMGQHQQQYSVTHRNSDLGIILVIKEVV